MSESREEAIERLNRRATELEAATAPKTSEHLAAQAVTSQAYKIIADLIGGVLVGLGLGLLVSVFFVISGVGQAMAGFLVDRVGARPVLFTALGLFVALYFGAGWLAALVTAILSANLVALTAMLLLNGWRDARERRQARGELTSR